MLSEDPAYLHILGLPAGTPLSNWYDLLGVPVFEGDRQKLEQAMLNRVVLVRRYQVGAYQQQSLALLNELSQAYVCLTDEESRQQYDRSLRDASTATKFEAVGRAEPKPQEPSPDAAPTCPQCAKPMPARTAICLHCGYRRAKPAPSRADTLSSAAAAAPPAFGSVELLRQDLSPEQLLARLNLMRGLYQANRLGDKHWISNHGLFCQLCRRPLATRTDAYGLDTPLLSSTVEFVNQYARRLEGLGKQQFQWPLNAKSFADLRETIARQSPQAVRLFCRNCAERYLKSPKIIG